MPPGLLGGLEVSYSSFLVVLYRTFCSPFLLPLLPLHLFSFSRRSPVVVNIIWRWCGGGAMGLHCQYEPEDNVSQATASIRATDLQRVECQCTVFEANSPTPGPGSLQTPLLQFASAMPTRTEGDLYAEAHTAQ